MRVMASIPLPKVLQLKKESELEILIKQQVREPENCSLLFVHSFVLILILPLWPSRCHLGLIITFVLTLGHD